MNVRASDIFSLQLIQHFLFMIYLVFWFVVNSRIRWFISHIRVSILTNPRTFYLMQLMTIPTEAEFTYEILLFFVNYFLKGGRSNSSVRQINRQNRVLLSHLHDTLSFVGCLPLLWESKQKQMVGCLQLYPRRSGGNCQTQFDDVASETLGVAIHWYRKWLVGMFKKNLAVVESVLSSVMSLRMRLEWRSCLVETNKKQKKS